MNPEHDTPGSPGEGDAPEPAGPEVRPAGGRDVRSGRSRRTSTVHTTWRVWWDLNRTHLADIKSRARRRAITTGVGTDAAIDPLGTKRDKVREALRKLVIEQRDRTLRGGALIALGRFGDEGDVDLFIQVIENRRLHHTVHESAALALGMLPPIEDRAARDRVLEYFSDIIKRDRTHLGVRAREFVILAAGMRARHDKRLLAPLLARLHSKFANTNEYGALVYAAGLSRDPMAVPELLAIARTGAVGKKKIPDVLRSHAVTAVSLSESPYLAERLTAILRSRKSGIHTRRSAALALGRLLRETEVSPSDARTATDRLRKVLGSRGDSLLRGFCAVALGGARDPQGIAELIHAVEGGDHQVKHFSVLALGLALPRLSAVQAKRVRALLTEELDRANEGEYVSALCIAAGLGGVTEAKHQLLERLKSYKRTEHVRGAAAQGLGLLGERSPEVEHDLVSVLKQSRGPLLEDTAVALGLLGKPGTPALLVRMLPKAKTTKIREHVILALGWIGTPITVESLMKIATQKGFKDGERGYACAALGMLGDRRIRDPLFTIDADVNYIATTYTTHQLIRIY